MIGYRIIFRDLVPKLLRGTALIHHANNIVSRLAAKPHGIGKRCGQIHHFTGHRAYHRASRYSDHRCYRGYVRPVRQYDLNRTSGVIDLTVYTQYRELLNPGRTGRCWRLSGGRDQAACRVRYPNRIGTALYITSCDRIGDRCREVLFGSRQRAAHRCASAQCDVRRKLWVVRLLSSTPVTEIVPLTSSMSPS